MKDGVREAEEELGKVYDFSKLLYLGKKIYIGTDVKGRERHNVVDVFMVEDESDIETYALQENEVYAICVCPIDELIKVHQVENYSFTIEGLTAHKEKINITVNKNSYPHNFDHYHYKIALLADRFLKGEKNLIY